MKGVPQPKRGEVESWQEKGNKKYSDVHGLQVPQFYRQYTVFMIFITQRCKISKKNFNHLQTSAEYPGKLRTFVPSTMTPRDMQLMGKAVQRWLSGLRWMGCRDLTLHSLCAPLPSHCPQPLIHTLMLPTFPQAPYTLLPGCWSNNHTSCLPFGGHNNWRHHSEPLVAGDGLVHCFQ